VDTILIFTRQGLPSFIEDGGTGYWKVNPSRANQMRYAVMCRKRHTHERVEGDEPHGTGFLVARISGLAPAPDGRWLIQFAEFAEINKPNLWPGHRIPTTYTALADLGIDPGTLHWTPMPEPKPTAVAARGAETVGDIVRRWKAGLAADLGMAPEQIDVSFRG
jgi:hypothetical protein